MEKFNLGYEQILKEKFPRLIYCRISGYGSDGPLGGFPGYDAVIQSAAGWFSVNGTSDSGPTRVGIPMVDMGTGLYSVVAMLMALTERNNSGKGQFIDMILYDCAISLLHPYLANYLLSNKTPEITGNQHPNISPYDKYPTKKGDIYIDDRNLKKHNIDNLRSYIGFVPQNSFLFSDTIENNIRCLLYTSDAADE